MRWVAAVLLTLFNVAAAIAAYHYTTKGVEQRLSLANTRCYQELSACEVKLEDCDTNLQGCNVYRRLCTATCSEHELWWKDDDDE